MLTTQNTLLCIIDIQQRLLPVLHETEAFQAACRKFLTGANQYATITFFW